MAKFGSRPAKSAVSGSNAAKQGRPHHGEPKETRARRKRAAAPPPSAATPQLADPVPVVPGLADPVPVVPGLADPVPVVPGLADPAPVVPGLAGPVPILPVGLADADDTSPFLRKATKPTPDRPRRQMLDSRLRVWSNGSQEVNEQRAAVSACVTAISTTSAVPGLAAAEGSTAAMPRPAKQDTQPLESEPAAENSFVNVFIELRRTRPDGTADAAPMLARLRKLPRIPGRRAVALPKRNLIAATVPISVLADLAAAPGVSHIYSAEPLCFEPPLRSAAGSTAPPLRRSPAKADGGKGVLLGIIDVGGFDFAHPDFVDEAGNTRFFRIWDMGGRPGRGLARPEAFDVGVELTRERMNAALAEARQEHNDPRRATELLRQSQQVQGSHATHVASIAAGNSGLCPKAQIAGVLIELPPSPDERSARRATFSDSSRIVLAVEYLCRLASEMGLPVSINISLGTNGGAHDSTGPVARWLGALMAAPGRALCVAAGNSGDASVRRRPFQFSSGPGKPPRTEQLVVSGPIHMAGRIASRGLEVELDWIVQGNLVADMSENELEIWYGASDRFSVALQPPEGAEWIVVSPRELVENQLLPDGTRVSIYNELYYPGNGANLIAVHLSPNYGTARPSGVRAGRWRVRLLGEDVRDGRFNAWIERDDLRSLSHAGLGTTTSLPSYFGEQSFTDSHTINSLACADCVIGVANLDVAAARVASSSSKGPSRDGRNKPDIAAPGTGILAANGFSGAAGQPWIPMTGTSMASPYVAGVVGLMLAAKPDLTAAQIGGILQRTAQPLPGTGFGWSAALGVGVINPGDCVNEALAFDQRQDVGP